MLSKWPVGKQNKTPNYLGRLGPVPRILMMVRCRRTTGLSKRLGGRGAKGHALAQERQTERCSEPQKEGTLLVFGPISTSDLQDHFDDKFVVLSSKVVVTH